MGATYSLTASILQLAVIDGVDAKAFLIDDVEIVRGDWGVSSIALLVHTRRVALL